MTDTLNGATALIIGGSGGIGLATAKRFAAAGARVAIGGRDRARGEAAVAALARDHDKCLYVPVDVTQADSVDAAVAIVVEHWGKLDCAFNNAGWEGVSAPLEQQTEANWQRMIETKLSGTWRCLRAEISCMRTQGHGTIVNMAGNWGLIGFPSFAPYCAAAHGIVGLTKAAALEVAGAGLRVNAVCPGAVDAPMLDRLVGGDVAIKTGFGDSLAIGRICSPEEVANAVVWLCSPESSYVNGASLPLDGGGTA